MALGAPTHLTGSLYVTGSISASLGFDGLTNVLSSSTQVDHDDTTNFVANEHIDHSSVTITGTGALTGGGDITTSRTITLDSGGGTFIAAVTSSLAGTGIVSSSAQMDTLFNLDGVVSSSAQIAGFGARITSGAADMVSGEVVLAVGKNAITSSDALAVDDGNLGIGTTSPDVRLHMIGDGPETSQFKMEQYNDSTDAADIRIKRARGTQASPADLQAGDFIFRLNIQGRDSGTFREYAALQFDVDDDQDACIYRLKTRGDAGGSSVTRYVVDGAGLHQYTGSVDFGGVVENQGGVRFSDNISASFGSGNDLHLYHDASNSLIRNTTGHLYIENQADNSDIVFKCDDGSGGNATYFFLDGGTSETDDLITTFPDNSRLTFGTGRDLKIYHDGSHSYIQDAGTGNLQILATNFQLNNAANSANMITATDAGAVTLFTDGNAKLATTSTGIDVTGLTNTDTLNTEGNATISGSLIVSASVGDNPHAVSVFGAISASNDIIGYHSSDERLKDNIQPIESPLEKISQISGVEFDWNEKQDLYKGHDIGVIAQEIEKILPEIVETRDSGFKAVRYEKIVALLIEAIKQQQLQIDELKDRL